MNQRRSFITDRTCPKCRKADAVYAEIVDQEQHQESFDAGSEAVMFLITTILFVNVSCTACGFLGATTLSKSHRSGPGGRGDASPDVGQAPVATAIDPDTAIGIILDRLRNPKHRWTAPW